MLWVRGPGACRVVAAGCLDLFLLLLLWGPSMSQASCRSWRMLQAQMWWKVTVLDIALGIVLQRTGLSIVLQFLTPNVFDWFHSTRALHQWPWGANQLGFFLLGGIGNRLLTQKVLHNFFLVGSPNCLLKVDSKLIKTWLLQTTIVRNVKRKHSNSSKNTIKIDIIQ